MGRWRASLIISTFARLSSKSLQTSNITRTTTPFLYSNNNPLIIQPCCCISTVPRFHFYNFRSFSAVPCPTPFSEDDFEENGSDPSCILDHIDPIKDQDFEKIPVRAFFLSTSIDLKSMQAENLSYVVPPSSRSSNYIALRFCNSSTNSTGTSVGEKASSSRYMVVYQYGSAVLFNMEEHEIESYLGIIKKHASGLLNEMRKDDYAVQEKPHLSQDMQGGADYIVLKSLDIDSIRIIGSVLGQSIALDYFVSQVDGMVEEFAGINRGMEKTGTFTMDRKKLFQLVGKANSNLADVILRVGLFDRSEIAWRDAKYAQIYEYLREEYEVTQRFGNLDYKLKFVEHNIHFLQEVLQNLATYRMNEDVLYCCC
ncbi:DUF155 domain-containing protein [Heracleum sosnowskyi]|uniref:DUF155 domain-containing protein n=1 Tax=Heracleum sosnowskyi TaxID=360622 RepID=A0AAD8MND3_9APIA|nr:DUF155 domain-containing protein [Heracleum sosnowskyi]